jgi:hypothetical protein
MLLGLSKRHSKALDMLAKDYLQKSWKDYPDALYGIRKYASAAYIMFCVVDWKKSIQKIVY